MKVLGCYRRRRRSALAAIVILAATVVLGACTGAEESAELPVQLTIWHHGGQPAERSLLADQVRRFNERSGSVRAAVVEIPEAEYPDRVQLAAITGELPDILDFDGPNMQNYVYQGKLRDLNFLVNSSTKADLTRSIRNQGMLGGKLYSVGAIDSGLGIYASRAALKAIGARLPRSYADAWSATEFERIMSRLAADDPDGKVLDISLNYGIGEWYTYGFAPVVWSAGGSLGRAPTYAGAEQSLATPAVTAALRQFGGWTRKYVDPNSVPDKDAFTNDRVPLSWGGHWRYAEYRAALGTDLIVLPLPDFGVGAKMNSGSWNWGVTTDSKHPRDAGSFLDFVMSTDEVLAASDASGAPPGTTTAARRSVLYRDGGPLALFAHALANACAEFPKPGCDSMSRPPTPAYPVITNAFQGLMKGVFSGTDIGRDLSQAARLIDTDYSANQGYELDQ